MVTDNPPPSCTSQEPQPAERQQASPQPTGTPDDAAKAHAEIQARGLEGRVQWVTSKRDFRARAHSNPLNDGLFKPPLDPSHLAMDKLFENAPSDRVQWCDIGCGYGGLLASLSVAFPTKVMLGLEIRDRVAEFCMRRVAEMRKEYPGSYGNVGFDRTNVMRYLPNYFTKGSLEKLFFCYPDPHFKKRKNRQRIISTELLAEYGYVLEEEIGVAYIVTDVPELFEWMVERFEKHPLFERRSEEEHRADPVSRFVRDMTDEAQRVEKSDRGKQDASFRRVKNPLIPTAFP
eukprot:GFKZ01003220.1.p1 GENE.GFKZ01003220.1~~GFKZ01003220.1.p1  ORF type:complete len:289 (+),score=42.88 GFKZ01003220.1:205-1071(+)